MPPKVISGGDNPYDIHDAKLSSSATAHESSSVTAHEISNSQCCRIRNIGFAFLSKICVYKNKRKYPCPAMVNYSYKVNSFVMIRADM